MVAARLIDLECKAALDRFFRPSKSQSQKAEAQNKEAARWGGFLFDLAISASIRS
jgi:hypothetical protein